VTFQIALFNVSRWRFVTSVRFPEKATLIPLKEKKANARAFVFGKKQRTNQ